MHLLPRDARLVATPRDEWAAVAAEQAGMPRLWRRVAVVAALLCVMDLLEIVLCDTGLPLSGRFQSAVFVAVAFHLALNAVSILIFLAMSALAVPMLAKGMGGNGDTRVGLPFAVYANANTGWLVLNALSLDATCHGAGAGWVFGEGLAAHALSWSIFAAYLAYAIHLSRHGAMALFGVPAGRATALAAILIALDLAVAWLFEVGPTPHVVLLGLLRA